MWPRITGSHALLVRSIRGFFEEDPEPLAKVESRIASANAPNVTQTVEKRILYQKDDLWGIQGDRPIKRREHCRKPFALGHKLQRLNRKLDDRFWVVQRYGKRGPDGNRSALAGAPCKALLVGYTEKRQCRNWGIESTVPVQIAKYSQGSGYEILAYSS